MIFWRIIVTLGLGVLVGCAAARPASQIGTELPYDPSRAFVRLEQLKPVPHLPPPGENFNRPIANRALKHYLIGRAWFDEYRWQDAIDQLEQALRDDPDSSDIHRLIGRACRYQGDLAKARQHLNRAVQLDADDVASYSILGRMAYEAGQYDQAIRQLRLALSCSNANPHNPETILAHLYLGQALLRRGYLLAGVEQLRRFERLVGRGAPLYYQHPELARLLRDRSGQVALLIGRASARMGRYRQAAQAYQRAVQARPEDPKLRRQYIQLLALAGQQGEATEQALELLERRPEDPQAIELALWVYQQFGKGGAVVSDLRRRLAARRNQPGLALALAQILHRKGQTGKAIELLQSLAGERPEVLQAQWRLARLLLQAGRDRQALEVLARAVPVKADAYIEVRKVLAELLDGADSSSRLLEAARRVSAAQRDDFALQYVAGLVGSISERTTLGESALRRSIELQPQFAGAYLELGRLYARQFRWSELIALGQAGLSAGLRLDGIYRLLARGYDGLDQIDQAEANYLMVLRHRPQDVAALRALAELYRRSGRLAQAEQQYRAILAIDPRDDQARQELIRSYLRRNELAGAQGQLAQLQRLGARGPVLSRCVAMVAYRLHRDASAYQRALARILKDNPDDVTTRYELAASLAASRRYEQAFEHVEAILSSDPGHQPARYLLAGIYAAWLEYELADQMLETLLAEHPNRRTWLLDQARVCLAEQRFDRATKLLKRLLDRAGSDEERAMYRAMLARAYVAAGQHEQAERLLQAWANEQPGRREPVAALLRLWRSLDQFDRAIALTERLLKTRPGDAWLRRQLLVDLALAGRHEQAEQRLLTWLAGEPESFQLNGQLITSLLLADRYEEAIELARNGLADPRRQLDYRWLLVRAYEYARRYDLAIAQVRRLQQELSNPRLDRELVRLLIWAGRFDQARQRIEQIIKASPGRRREMRRLLVLLYRRAGRADLAEQELQDLYDSDPYDPSVNNDLGYSWADQGRKLDQAEQMLRFAVGQRPQEPAYLDSLGWLLYKKGQFAPARRYLVGAVRAVGGDDPVIYDHLGDAYWRLGEAELAGQSWRKAVRLARRQLRLHEELGEPDVLERAARKLQQLEQERRPDVAAVAVQLGATGGR